MGTNPDNEVYEAGVVCPVCEIILFEDITPKYVEVTFEGIVPCPGIAEYPPNGTFLLEQWIADPCRWRHVCPPLLIEWSFTAIDSFLTAAIFMQSWFAQQIDDICQDEFTNQNALCGPFVIGRFGTGIIRWGPNIGPQGNSGYELGDPCPLCHACLFACHTPKWVEVKIADVKRCFGFPGPLPNGLQLMEQIAPCVWQDVGATWTMTWTLDRLQSLFTITDWLGRPVFAEVIVKSCQTQFTNHNINQCFIPPTQCYDGTAEIRWGVMMELTPPGP